MSADITAILDDLAAGRIDTAEAYRRIHAASAAEESGDPTPHGDASSEDDASTDAHGPGEHGAGAGPTGTRDDRASGDGRGPRRGADRGFLDQFSIPEEARAGLRTAWQVVSGMAESVGETVSATMSSAPRRARTESREDVVTVPSDIDRVRLRCAGRRVRVVGDRAVSGLEIEGRHSRRRLGRIVEVDVEGHIAPDLSVLKKFQVPTDLDGVKDLGLGKEVVVRVHPDLPVDVDLSGGALRISGVERLGQVRVTAGPVEIRGVHQIEDGLFQACNAIVSGPIDTGRSRLRVESGNLTVHLDEGANVAVRASARTGLVVWPDGGQADEYVVGNGAAWLDLTCLVGRIAVRTD